MAELTKPQAALKALAERQGFLVRLDLYQGPRLGTRGQVLGADEEAMAIVGAWPKADRLRLPTGAVVAFHCRWWSDGIVSLTWVRGESMPHVGNLATLKARLNTPLTGKPHEVQGEWTGHREVVAHLRASYVGDEVLP